jgi:hypothetical protein
MKEIKRVNGAKRKGRNAGGRKMIVVVKRQ